MGIGIIAPLEVASSYCDSDWSDSTLRFKNKPAVDKHEDPNRRLRKQKLRPPFFFNLPTKALKGSGDFVFALIVLNSAEVYHRRRARLHKAQDLWLGLLFHTNFPQHGSSCPDKIFIDIGIEATFGSEWIFAGLISPSEKTVIFINPKSA